MSTDFFDPSSSDNEDDHRNPTSLRTVLKRIARDARRVSPVSALARKFSSIALSSSGSHAHPQSSMLTHAPEIESIPARLSVSTSARSTPDAVISLALQLKNTHLQPFECPNCAHRFALRRTRDMHKSQCRQRPHTVAFAKDKTSVPT
jgi:uncharacterized protein YlaI